MYDKTSHTHKLKKSRKNGNLVYLLLFNSNGGGPALAPCPWAVHKRPIRVVDGVVGVADVIDEVDGFRMVAVEDGGRMPVGLGNRDDAVDMSLLIDFSDGAGDGARRSAEAAPLSDGDADGSWFGSLILMALYGFLFVHLILTL